MDRPRGFRQPIFIILAVAIMLGPFLALLWDVRAGLALMAVALTACGLLLRDAMAAAAPGTHRWINAVVVVNLLLAVACTVALVWLVVR